MNEASKVPRWAKDIESNLIASITSAKNEVIDSLRAARTKPGPNGRGPKNTRMMKLQRTAVQLYVEIEKHRHISTVTVQDCYHVWNDPEVKGIWDKAATRSDARRGYPDLKSLRNGVIYWLVTVPKTKTRRN